MMPNRKRINERTLSAVTMTFSIKENQTLDLDRWKSKRGWWSGGSHGQRCRAPAACVLKRGDLTQQRPAAARWSHGSLACRQSSDVPSLWRRWGWLVGRRSGQPGRGGGGVAALPASGRGSGRTGRGAASPGRGSKEQRAAVPWFNSLSSSPIELGQHSRRCMVSGRSSLSSLVLIASIARHPRVLP